MATQITDQAHFNKNLAHSFPFPPILYSLFVSFVPFFPLSSLIFLTSILLPFSFHAFHRTLHFLFLSSLCTSHLFICFPFYRFLPCPVLLFRPFYPLLLHFLLFTDPRRQRQLTLAELTRSTQPCIPLGSLNRVPASAGVRAGMSPLPGGRVSDPMRHVSSRSGVANLRTAIHLLLTYLLTPA